MFFNIMPGYEKVIFENQPTATSFKARFLFFGPTFVSEEQWPNSLSLLWLLLRRVFHRQLHFLTNFGCFLFGTLNWPARVCAALEVLAGRYPCSCCRTSSPTSSHPVCLANDLVWLLWNSNYFFMLHCNKIAILCGLPTDNNNNNGGINQKIGKIAKRKCSHWKGISKWPQTVGKMEYEEESQI